MCPNRTGGDPSPSGEDPRFDPDPRNESEKGDEDETVETRSGEMALPISPARRRTAAAIALLLIVLIVTFLVWFIASNAERAEDGARILGSPSPVTAIRAPNG